MSKQESMPLVGKSGVPERVDGAPSRDVESGIAAPSPSKKKVTCVCFDISSLPEKLQITLLSLGVCFFFLLNGSLEETMFATKKFEHAWYMTFYELICFAGFAAFERAGKGEKVLSHEVPYLRHFYVGAAMTLSRGLTNVSLEYLSYPTQVIFKSGKLFTVMVASVLVLNKKYNFFDYSAALLLAVSAAFFSVGDKSGIAFSATGIIIVLVSLVMDALHSVSQDLLLRTYNASLSETLLFTNLFAAGCCFVKLIVAGELLPAMRACAEDPNLYWMFIVRALIVYLGVLCFVSLIKTFGVVFATGVTTVRKILTVLMSFIVFPKVFHMFYLYGIIVFALAMVANFFSVRYEKAKKAAEAASPQHSSSSSGTK